MSNSVILRRCGTLSEALTCKGALLSRGIWCDIDNGEHAAVDWGIVPAIGGVHIRVCSSDYQAAKQAIIDQINDAPAILELHAGAYEPVEPRGRWKAVSMIVIWFGLANLLLGYSLVWLDQIIPKEWIPETTPNTYWVDSSVGVSLAPPGPGVDGLSFLFVLALFTFFELVSSRPDHPRKEPQV